MLTKLHVITFCCIVTCCYFGQCSEIQRSLKKDNVVSISPVYNIKEMNVESLGKQKKLMHKESRKMLIGEKQQELNILQTDTVVKPLKVKKLKSSHSHSKNKKLLKKMGFTKVKAPNNNNRKRLAIQSRRHASPDDSHMFIVKLPPNFYYYSSPTNKDSIDIPIAEAKHGSRHHSRNSLIQQTATELTNTNGKKLSFPFNSNGKPGRIYHWNLPIIKDILEDEQRFRHIATAHKDHLINIKDIPTWTKPWETVEKSNGKSSKANYKKSIKRKSPSYYAPANAVNKSSFNKYFAGNGKPNGFYVIKENAKPLYYKNIVP